MRANSLALRLFLTAAAWTAAILLITGIVLSGFYRGSVERAFDRRLGVFLKTLVADIAAPDDGGGGEQRSTQALGEPLFELPLSGWYWQITRIDVKSEPRASRSLWDGTLPRIGDPAAPNAGGVRQGYVRGPEDQRLRLAERTIDLDEEGKYLVAVAGDAGEIDDEIRAFDRWLLITFSCLAVVLLLTTTFQVRFGLAPLKRISQSLAAIRSGSSERLEGKFPEEIAPLARETNALIEANREIVDRARTHVGNLAHALKTPLSVMVNEAALRGDDPLAVKVREQVEIMRDQVSHHLQRARMAARATTVGTLTEVVPTVEALARTMEKIYRDRGVTVGVDAAQAVKFRGEQQDLEEMVGNLIDNACKWAQGRVFVAITPEKAAEGREAVRIVIDDDGPGLTAAQREKVAKRGQRLDETKPGSGLGLSIVTDLSSLYGGGLTLGNAPIGGLRAELVLPSG
ncbi:sensor protein PhoQ [Variibacter gotjawalensis]|uniref:histidine kinase n=1 Tax=Variibacter gotjawalensis TaxID=1333996 RepID=A0A0S3PZ79_9BRAD|nr:ATP-binding protein [Variibacter gotjawalensis]NIK47048.1 signal transduction histidine kinase [Variibacter gotjawalensis]RZS48953.1 signal transduction histidine kinase [Variibacter gotjawalensis]BAT61211.1 sensor protein PhoQ [Variibacter gotjawalensis]